MVERRRIKAPTHPNSGNINYVKRMDYSPPFVSIFSSI